MRPDVQADFDWGRQFIPELRGIVGRHIVTEAAWAEDAKRATDLIVLRADDVRVACRVRRHAYLERYGDEFTIRASRPGGVRTELAKVIEGWARYMVYGFASAGDVAPLSAWILLDLHEFRGWFAHELVRLPAGDFPGIEVPNPDGTKGRAFRIADLPAAAVLDRQRAMVLA